MPKPIGAKVKPPAGAPATAPPPPAGPPLDPAVAAAREELASAEKKRAALVDELRHVEKQIYDLETRYLTNANPSGTALRGYDGLLSAAASASAPKRSTPRADDRIFSLSSSTGAAHKGGGGGVV